jgi:hypothetical protein
MLILKVSRPLKDRENAVFVALFYQSSRGAIKMKNKNSSLITVPWLQGMGGNSRRLRR